uniref:RHS repeat-associated core domain-containing protein n=1 Tax=Alkaliphilus transvaalensis TaxID=114628 RepID=UPI000555A151
DTITQQYYLRARYYNPIIGRFTQEDTYRGDGLNLYSYCQNSPVMYYDPSGYFCEEKGNAFQVDAGASSINGKEKSGPSLGQRIGSVFSGSFMMYLGASAIMVGATALTVATGGLGAPVLIAAGTIITGAGLTAMGANEVVYGLSGKNFALDNVFKGNVEAYSTAQMLLTMGTVSGMQYSSIYTQQEIAFRNAAKETGNTDWITNKGYKPQPGERTLEGFMKKNISPDAEVGLYTKSSGKWRGYVTNKT